MNVVAKFGEILSYPVRSYQVTPYYVDVLGMCLQIIEGKELPRSCCQAR